MNRRIKLLSLILAVLLTLTLPACAVKPTPNGTEDNGNSDTSKPNSNIEYRGTKITKLTYETVDYNGGATDVNVLDFSANTFTYNGYFPPYIDMNDPSRTVTSEFTEEEEKLFLDTCYANGLFALEEKYTHDGIVCDGGEWTLTIEYVDGTVKLSNGINEGPYDIFNKCPARLLQSLRARHRYNRASTSL